MFWPIALRCKLTILGNCLSVRIKLYFTHHVTLFSARVWSIMESLTIRNCIRKKNICQVMHSHQCLLKKQCRHYERLIEFIRDEQHQFIIGKAKWNFTFFQKLQMSALRNILAIFHIFPIHRLKRIQHIHDLCCKKKRCYIVQET